MMMMSKEVSTIRHPIQLHFPLGASAIRTRHRLTLISVQKLEIFLQLRNCRSFARQPKGYRRTRCQCEDVSFHAVDRPAIKDARRPAFPLAAELARHRIVGVRPVLKADARGFSRPLRGRRARHDLPLSGHYNDVARVPEKNRAIRMHVTDLRAVTRPEGHARLANREPTRLLQAKRDFDAARLGVVDCLIERLGSRTAGQDGGSQCGRRNEMATSSHWIALMSPTHVGRPYPRTCSIAAALVDFDAL